jgi:acetyl-CoA carboxylase biotin carboxyl carrier protein
MKGRVILMEMENIIKLIETVSNSNLTSFQYVEGDSSLTLEINRNTVNHNITEMKADITEETTLTKDCSQSKALTITSPMVGTFYASKAESSDPYINVGDIIKKGQTIGIVEAMKLMNEIESEYDGVVEAILVKNKDMIEYGQPLVRIKPL